MIGIMYCIGYVDAPIMIGVMYCIGYIGMAIMICIMYCIMYVHRYANFVRVLLSRTYLYYSVSYERYITVPFIFYFFSVQYSVTSPAEICFI